jgi:hypothetical protein
MLNTSEAANKQGTRSKIFTRRHKIYNHLNSHYQETEGIAFLDILEYDGKLHFARSYA